MLANFKKLTNLKTKNTTQNKKNGLVMLEGNSLLQTAWPQTGNV